MDVAYDYAGDDVAAMVLSETQIDSELVLVVLPLYWRGDLL
jgi:hypothetical protein